jgi:hypothetical protein
MKSARILLIASAAVALCSCRSNKPDFGIHESRPQSPPVVTTAQSSV